MGNTSRNILATIVIVLLLALLGGMVWFDRQSKEKVITETQTRIETTSLIESSNETEGESRESSQEVSEEIKDQESETVISVTESSDNQTLLPNTLVGLPQKESHNEFKAEPGRVILRSLGNISTPQIISEMADVQNPLYLEYTGQATSEGDKVTGEPVNGYDFLPMFSEISPYINYADITLANLNMPVAYPQMPLTSAEGYNAPKAILMSLKALGTDIVTNANGNILDLGEAGVYATLNNIQDAGLTSVGLYTSPEAREEAVIQEINGIKLAFLSYAPADSLPVMDETNNLVATNNLDEMVTDITHLVDQVDAVIVSLQMTNDEELLPTNGIGDIYQALSDAGATLIIGNNPNKVQPTEWLNDGKTFAIYSQGSLLKTSPENILSEAGILEVTFERNQDGEVQLINPRFMPVTFAREEEKFLQILPLADYQKFKLDGGESLWQSLKEQMVVYTDNVEVVTHLETALTSLTKDTFRE